MIRIDEANFVVNCVRNIHHVAKGVSADTERSVKKRGRANPPLVEPDVVPVVVPPARVMTLLLG